MLFEVAKLTLGLMIALFHKPIADWIREQDLQLVVIARQRGVPLPGVPTTETARTIYFWMGISVAVFQLTQIWMLYR